MKQILFTVIFLSSLILNAQKIYTIDITIEDYVESVVMLADFYGDKNNIIDTLYTDKDGRILTTFDSNRPAGMYRAFVTQESFFDFIFNNEDIILKTIVEAPMDSLNVVQSLENKLYYDFLRADQSFMMKLELLSPLLSYFPKEDEFYTTAKIKFLRTQQARDSYILDTKKSYPNAYSTKIIMFQRTPLISAGLSDFEKAEFIRTHYFDKVNFDDPELLRCDVYPNKLISYLGLYSNRNLSQDQLEKVFIHAIDNLMSKPFDNLLVKEYVIQYLIGGFERYGFEEVLVHIASTYNDEKACENEERKSDLQSRLDNYKKLAVGKIAPDIEIPTMDGKMIKLEDIDSEYTMLIFWATWCPHCTQMMPEIYELYKNQEDKKIEVLSISLDEDKEALISYLDEKKFSWINATELKSWSSKVAIDYNIYATPTIILIDKERKILSKPLSMGKIQQEFKSRK